MRKQNAEFKTAFTSEANQKLKNTDSFGFVELDKFACYVIADGIDDNLDAMSARLAVDTILSAFMETPSMRKGAILRYMNSANRALVEAKSKMRLKASVTVIVTDYVRLRWAQAGNTRFRLYRDGFLRESSQDQSLSMDLVRDEKLPADKLAQHEERHNLYCYVGQEREFRPFVSKKITLMDSDCVALFTRGVWEHLDDGELRDAYADATDDPQPTVDAVEDMLLSRQPETLEKYTFAAIFFNKVYADPQRRRKIRRAIIIGAVVLVAVIVLTILLIVMHNRRVKNIAAMEQSFYDTVEYIQSDNYIRAKDTCEKTLELATKLRNQGIIADASNYMKLIESVIAGDEKLSDGQYVDAHRDFLNARNRARYADHLGSEYIDERLRQTGDYMTVYDLIALGDVLAQSLQYDKAEEQYLAAKALSGKIFFDRGRDNAMAALEKLYADQKKEQEQAASAAQELAESENAAASVLAEGDAAFARGDWEAAQSFYLTALQKYRELDDQTMLGTVSAKLGVVKSRLAEQSKLEAEAQEYMLFAADAYGDKNYTQAKKYYLLARDVYAELGNDAKLAEISRRLEFIELGISEEESLKAEGAGENEDLENDTGKQEAKQQENEQERLEAERFAEQRRLEEESRRETETAEVCILGAPPQELRI